MEAVAPETAEYVATMPERHAAEHQYRPTRQERRAFVLTLKRRQRNTVRRMRRAALDLARQKNAGGEPNDEAQPETEAQQ